MNKLSIKARVTLWYTLFMSLLTVIVLVIVFTVGGQQIHSSVSVRLEDAVDATIDEIDFDHEDGFDFEDVSVYGNGVYILVYDSEGYNIFGMLPSSISTAQTPDFSNGEIQSFSDGLDEWLCLDRWQVYYDDGVQSSGIWIRGIVSQTYADSGLAVVLNLVGVFFPVFIVLIVIAGYFITKRAFRPVQAIRRTAEEISNSNDLSRRIGIKGGNDEIYQLAYTFDNMLDRIESAFKREKQFTSDASHELRTPVAVISAQAEYALTAEITEEERKENLKVILGQARKMSDLISQLLTLSRADAGKIKLQKERVNLSELLEMVAAEEGMRAESKNITIETNIIPDIYMDADATLLMRCFINLIENAIVYGKQDGHIWISLRSDNEKTEARIKDDGIGIGRENLARIWERFYQVDPSRSAREEGNAGLGLSMVKWIVGAHNGRVYAMSELGVGSEFIVEFWREG